jgi:phosphotransferase system HPr-like phosphotransfer protein
MGTVLVIQCDGDDEQHALDALVKLIASKFDED